jgi:hypothetical protein
MFFYLVFSCAIVLKLWSSKLLFLAVTFSICALLSRFLAPDNGLRYLLTNQISIEFLYGMLAAELLVNVRPICSHRAARSLSIILIGFGAGALLLTIKFALLLTIKFTMRMRYALPFMGFQSPVSCSERPCSDQLQPRLY